VALSSRPGRSSATPMEKPDLGFRAPRKALQARRGGRQVRAAPLHLGRVHFAHPDRAR
jgi:hypothetical protein